MKKLGQQLKQPGKFTHQFLKKKSQDSSQSASDGEEHQQNESQVKQQSVPKHKQIEKEKYQRKVITKPNEPSALRLEQMNRTFQRLQQNGEDFLSKLQLNHQLLNQLVNLKEKFVCACKRKVKYYCLYCDNRCSLLQGIPPVILPFSLYFLQHTSQKLNRSSVAPMRYLSPSITYYQFASKQQERNQRQVFDKLPPPNSNTYVLFPHKDSKKLTQIDQPIQNVVVLDCTWFQTDQMITDLQERGYNKFIRLEGYQSCFWRYNHHGEEALSSAESVMHFLREWQSKRHEQIGKYDTLMFLYALSLKMVEKSMHNQ